jgi:hypothetical protein
VTVGIARSYLNRGICRFRGHKLREELISAESGHSELCCCRCGWSYDCYF